MRADLSSSLPLATSGARVKHRPEQNCRVIHKPEQDCRVDKRGIVRQTQNAASEKEGGIGIGCGQEMQYVRLWQRESGRICFHDQQLEQRWAMA